ncbi:hypothetical protein GC176_13370, partial [bacterium]|nr:hypothetical protein [bacterium]
MKWQNWLQNLAQRTRTSARRRRKGRKQHTAGWYRRAALSNPTEFLETRTLLTVNVLGASASSFDISATDTTETLSSYSVDAGSDRVLIVTTTMGYSDASTNGSDVLSVTFDGNPMTKESDFISGSNGLGLEFWYLALGDSVSATVGDIVVTYDTMSTVQGVIATAFDGADQVAPISATVSDTSTATGLDISVPSAVGDHVLDAIILFETNDTGTLTADGSQVVQANADTFTDTPVGVSTEAGAAGNVAMTWTETDALTAIVHAGANIQQAAGPAVNLSVDVSSGSETAGTVVTVTATADSAVSGAQTIDLGVSGTGITAGDYSLSNTTITIPDGMTTGSVTFTIADDQRLEATETATLTISNPSSGITLGSTTSQNVTITDNESATVSIGSGTDSVTESAGGTPSTTVPVTLTISASGTGTVGSDVPITAGLAGNSDYSNTDASFGTGDFTSTMQNLTVTAVNDNRLEATTESFAGQTLAVTLSSGAAVTVDGASGSRQVDVTDNESGVVSIANGTDAVTEGGATANVTVTLDITSDGTGVVGSDVAVGVGLTTNGDFTDADASIAAGDGASLTDDIVLTAVDDLRLEMSTESFAGQTLDGSSLTTGGADVSISGTSGSRQVDVTDNESATVSIGSGTDSLTEDAGGTPSATVPVTLTITSSGTGTVGSDVTITAGLAGNSDYSNSDASFGTGDFTSTMQNLTVTAINDNRLEAITESFAGQTLSVTGANGADVTVDGGSGSRQVDVADNESAIVSIGSATDTVTENGATANVTATLDITSDGTGTIGTDVTVSVGLTTNADFSDADASFAAATDGASQMQNIVLTAVDDQLLEATTESYAGQTLTDLMTGGASVTISGTSGSRQVDVNDNETGALSVAYSDVAEGGGVQTVATVTLTITSTGAGPVQLGNGITLSADINDQGTGTAVDTTDYATPGTQTVTFDSNAATASTRTTSLNPVDDRRVEGDETVDLVLENLSAGGTSSALSGVLTGSPNILDDDTATVTFDSATSNVDEDTVDHVIGVTLTINAVGTVGTDGLDRSVSVDVTDAGTGTATEGTAVNDDYTYTSPTTLTFSPFNGVSTASDSVTLQIREDIVDDDAETINLATSINTDNTGGQVTSSDTHQVTINDDDTSTAFFEFPADGSADTIRIVNNAGTIEVYSGATLLTSRSFASITDMIFNGADGEDDILNVDLTGGDVIPAGGIQFNGGTGGNDSLTITGGAQGTVTYNYDATTAGDGDVMMSAFGTITYTGLEPISNTGTATDVIFNLPAGVANSDAVLQDSGANNDGVNELTGSTFEDTFFMNPSGSLTVNLGTMGDTLAVNTFDTGYGASLIINGDGTASDRVDMTNVDIDTGGNGRGLLVTEVETLNITGGTIANNDATGGVGGGALIVNSTSGTDTTAMLTGVAFGGNTADDGGGLYLDGGATATLDGVTIQSNTVTGQGGGLFNNGGTVTIQNSSLVDDNEAQVVADAAGGGIYNTNGGTLTVTSSTITNNRATDGWGGGIEHDATTLLTLTSVTLDGNTAVAGGGLDVDVTGDVNITGGSVSGNMATADDGGGIYYGDGSGGTLTIDGTTIDGNTADGNGGGIYANDDVVLQNGVTITNNTATNGDGGGVYNDGASLTVDASSIGTTGNGNDATAGSGGGIYNTGDLTLQNLANVSANTAGTNGGGLYLDGASGTISISDTDIDGNTASGAASTNGGGGVFNDGLTLTLDNTVTITNNQADGAAGSGGGLFNNTGGVLNLTGTLIDGNSANRAGGGIEDNSGAGLGVTLTNVTLTNNDVDGGAGSPNPGNGGGLHVTGAGDVLIDGGTITGNDAREEGGGLWIGTGILTISDTSGSVLIDGNTASGNSMDQGGGGIFSAGGDVVIQDNGPNTVTISNNVADGTMGSGGGILIDAGGTLVATGAIIDSNSANRAGGGIEDNSGAGLGVTLTNVSLTNNDVDGGAGSPNPGNGGGLHVTGAGSVNITGGTVSGNDAAEEGGGLWNGSGTMTIDGVTISGNTASGNLFDQGGGGVFVSAGGTVNVQNGSLVTGNTADGTSGRGGGFVNESGTLNITDSTVTLNDATNTAGGGIANNNGTLTVTNSTISSNTAGAIGGGVFNAGTATIQSNSMVTGNTATTNGGGIYNQDTLDVDGSTVSGNTATNGDGGGIWSSISLTLENTTVVSGNMAGDNGGGLFLSSGTTSVSISDTSIDGNTADGTLGTEGGGGLFNQGVTFSLSSNVSITNNTASAGNGGGIFNSGGDITLSGATVTVNNNDATVGSGGGIFNDGSATLDVDGADVSSNTAGTDGGGIWNAGMATVQNGATVGSNSATSDGGGIYNTGTLIVDGATVGGTGTSNMAGADGGGIWNDGDLTLQGGAEVSANTAGSDGGGVYLDGASGAVSIGSATIDGNTANGATATEGGGGIFNDGLTLVIGSTTSITNNTASAGNGGGLFNSNSGDVTLNGTTVTGNDATNEDGGGVYNPTGSVLQLNGADVSSNTAGTDGAGVWNEGTLVVIGGSTVNSNDANRDGGGIWNGGSLTVNGALFDQNTAGVNGGGLYLESGSTNTIQNAMITENTASGSAATNGGGGIYNNGNTLSLDGTVLIDGNDADGTQGSGGGIFNNTGGVLTLNGTTITNNSAERAGGGIEDNSGAGLGVILTSVTLDSNHALGTDVSAPGNGGGLHVSNGGDVNITGGTVNSNTAAEEGGGLWNHTGTMTIVDVQIDGNTASGDASTNGGGGIFNAAGIVTTNEGTTITNNVADGTSGSGGGVFNDGGSFTATGTLIDGNQANRAGGGIETNVGTVILNDITLTSNNAGVAPAVANPGNGGGLHITGAGNVTINSNGVFGPSTIDGNTAAAEGGGLWNSSSGTLILNANGADDLFITNNTAAGDADPTGDITLLQGGGGLFNDGGSVRITGTDNDNAVIIQGNDATGATYGSGGGILSIGGSVDADGAGTAIGNILIDGNTAVRSGGGIEIVSGTLTLTNSLITGNTVGSSPGNGGGVHISNDGSVTLDAVTISGNIAANEGGGLWNSADGTMTLTNVTISGNSTTSGDGGGIFSVGGGSGVVDADSVTITLNDAGSGNGSGIASGAGGVTLRNTIVAQNPGGGTEENLFGSVDSTDYNLIGDPDNGVLQAPTNETIFNGDAILGPLQDNGNPNEVNGVPIPTHLPSAGSPAIGTGDTVLPVDQNDTDRPQASRDDIGAVEVQLNGFVIDAGAQANDGNPDEFVIIQDNMGTADPSDDEVVVYVNSVEVFRDSAVTTGQIIIRGSSDDDTLIMDNSEGLIQSHIIFDGDGTGTPSPSSVFNPGGFDTLVLRGSTPTTTTYNPGESADSGAIFQENNAITQRVEFFGLEPVQVVGTGAGDTLVLGSIVLGAGFPQALDGANTITYREGDNSQSEFHPVFGAAATGVAGGAVTGLIEVDGFEGLEFSNFGTLNINAGSGSDEISLNHRDVPSDLTAINVDGGDPTAGSDTVIVTANGTADTIAVTGVSTDGAIVDVTLDTAGTPVMQPTVVVTGAEHLVLDGAGGNDTLSVTGSANNELFNLLPSVSASLGSGAYDAGELRISDATAIAALIPIAFEDLGLSGGISLDGVGSGDTLVIQGTQLDDTFLVNADDSINSTLLVPVAVTNIPKLTLVTGDGNDNASIDGSAGYLTVNVQSGEGSDAVTVTAGAGDDVVVDLVAGTVTGTTIGTVSLTGTETLNIDGGDGTNTVTVNGLGSTTGLSALNIDGTNLASLTVDGTADDDVLVFNPTSATAGSISNSAGSSSLAVSYSGLASTLNATGGSGGFDILEVLGTADDDTITSTATSITRDGTVTFDGTIEQTNILAGAGNDSITLGALATLKVLDGGDGDDTIDASAAVDATIIGGAGDDNLVGSPVADLIDGGDGSDTITAGAGDDTIFGGAGNDVVEGGTGADQFFGGDGSDTFTWNVGDGSDLVEGGEGSDNLLFNGSAADEAFGLSDTGGRLELTRDVGSITMDIAGVENVAIDAMGGADSFNVDELTTTGVANLLLDLGTDADGDTDAVVIGTSVGADNVSVVADGTDQVLVAGLSAQIFIQGTTDSTDTLTVNGFEGDDTLTAEAAAGTELAITFNGGAGNDVLSGYATLNGDGGNDTLEGGEGANAINGGLGDDVIVLSGGDDTISGGGGFDVVEYNGTEADDTLSLVEAANVLTVSGLLTGTADVTAADIERIDVTGGSGDDDITLDAVTTQALVDAGAGDDGVDASTMTAASVTVFGGAGKDSISGGDQADELSGGAGDDFITGGMGDDVISGGEGFDQIRGNEGDDAIDGGTGVD